MGFSADSLPWVGMLPSFVTQREVNGTDSEASERDSLGAEWISAAFSGEGMVHAWLCGQALGTMVLSKDGRFVDSKPAGLSWFPEEMLVNEKRIRASVLRLLNDKSATGTSNL